MDDFSFIFINIAQNDIIIIFNLIKMHTLVTIKYTIKACFLLSITDRGYS